MCYTMYYKTGSFELIYMVFSGITDNIIWINRANFQGPQVSQCGDNEPVQNRVMSSISATIHPNSSKCMLSRIIWSGAQLYKVFFDFRKSLKNGKAFIRESAAISNVLYNVL